MWGGFSTINQCKITELTVKDRVRSDIGTSEQLTNWSDIDWKTVKKRVRNLRQRIYRATKNHQWNKVRSLMKLMLRSYIFCPNLYFGCAIKNLLKVG